MGNSLLAILAKPCTIVKGIWPDFGATLKFHKNLIMI